MNDKVLITGGAGFIGSNYVEYILNNSEDEIFVLDKLTYAGNMKNLEAVSDKITFIEGDICDAQLIHKLFLEHQFKKVVHFAAESHVDNSISGPSEFIQTNIVGTFNLVESAYKTWMSAPNDLKDEFRNARFLHISTDEVYGTLGETGFFTEETSYDPKSPYSASKAALHTLTECMAQELVETGIKINCLALGSAQTEMLEAAFPGYESPVMAFEMGKYIADFARTGHKFFNGKVLPVAVTTP